MTGQGDATAGRRFRLTRLGAAVLIAGAAVAVTWLRTPYRQIEAVVAAWVSRVLTASHSVVNRHTETFFLNVGSPKVFGVVVTPECSSAIVTAVVLGITAVAVATTRFSLPRALLAALAAAGGFGVLNLIRLVVIALASDRWGIVSGYHWSHIWAGTFITVFGGLAAAAAYLVILGGGPAVARSRSSQED